jgi:magnesium transporter
MVKTIDLEVQTIRDLLEENAFDEIRKRFARADPADLADTFDELESEELEELFKILDNETASEIIVEMESDEIDEVVENFPPSKIADIIREMAPDDAADFFNDLGELEQDRVLHFLQPPERKELTDLTHYAEDSAGGKMTTELCAVSRDATVQQAIHAMVEADFADPITMVFAIDRDRKLAGCIHISELISKPGKALVGEVIEEPLSVAQVDDDQMDVARDFQKYDLYVMPVVDAENHLVGRITADDVMDVFDEEAAEDMARMSGAPDIEYKVDSPFAIVKLRLPWLMITMVAGTLVSFVVQEIVSLRNAALLAAFVPVILAMGGNTGMQASAVTIRSIALGEIEFKSLFAVFLRELLVGAIMGVVCGCLISLGVWLNLVYFSHQEVSISIFRLILVVSGSMFVAMSFAALSGTVMPIVLNRFRIDPAVASGPFVTTGNDLSASLIYLGMCIMLLSI